MWTGSFTCRRAAGSSWAGCCGESCLALTLCTLLTLFAPSAPAAILDGFQVDIRNKAEWRRRLGISDQFIFEAGTNVLITAVVTSSNVTYTISVPGGGGTGTNITTTVVGVTNLNTLSDAIQTFATGTSGADFAIASAAGVHTFNLPTASSVNRGALSTADWTTFNAKQGAITWQSNGTTIATAPTTVNVSNATHMAVSGGTLTLGAGSGGSGTPVGNSGAIQFADTGAFDGDANKFVFHETNITLIIRNGLPQSIMLSPTTIIGVNSHALNMGAGGTSNWYFGNISKEFSPLVSNAVDLATPSTPVKAAYIGTNDSRDVRAQRAWFTNDVTMTAGKVISAPDGTTGNRAILFADSSTSGLYQDSGEDIATFDSDGEFYSFANDKYVYDTAVDENRFGAANNTFNGLANFAGVLRPSANNTYSIAQADQRWKDGWFGNTLNTTGFVAGVTYAPALVNGSYTNSTNNLLVMIPNGSTRTQWLNSACAVGALQGAFDRLGTASGTNIYVKATSGNVHTGAVDVINTDFGSKTFQWDGTNWWRIYQN